MASHLWQVIKLLWWNFPPNQVKPNCSTDPEWQNSSLVSDSPNLCCWLFFQKEVLDRWGISEATFSPHSVLQIFQAIVV